MSRTYRRKDRYAKTDMAWKLFDHDSCTHSQPNPPLLDPKSKEGKRRIAQYHSDKSCNFKEPGPSWFRNMFTERPQRQEGRLVLLSFIRNPEQEVILNSKNKLEYWT